MAYSFKLYNRDESELWELPYERISLKEELNRGLDASLEIPFPSFSKYASKLNTTVKNILAGGFRSWRLYRDDSLLYRGLPVHAAMSGGEAGATSISVNITDYMGFLSRRHTPEYLFYASEDASDILWNEIDRTQNDSSGHGDLGLTRGTQATVKNRQRTLRFDKILDLAVGMSRAKVVDGYDWWIDTSLQVNTADMRGNERPEIVFSEFNTLSWTANLPLLGRLANRVHVLGEGMGDDMISVTRENTTVMEMWTLVEESLNEKSVSSTTLLEERGDRLLEKRAEPKIVFALSTRDTAPDVIDYEVGDIVRVQRPEIDFNELLRINSRAMTIYSSGQAIIDLTFEEVDL